MKLDILGKVLKNLLKIGALIGMVLLIFMIPIIDFLGYEFNLLFLMLYPNGICFLILIIQFIMLFDSLGKNEPFCDLVIKKLHNCMIITSLMFIITVIMIIISFFIYHYSLVFNLCISFMAILFFGVSIAFYILKNLFIQAVFIKNEMDLTI